MARRLTVILTITLVWLLAGPGIVFAQSGPVTSKGSSIIMASGRNSICIQETPSAPPKITKISVKGKIIGLASNSTACFGVTDNSEIFYSKDLKSWNVINFNEAYKGYYPQVRFVGIAALAANVAVAGVSDSGAPAVYTSTKGTVWSERSLTYSQGDRTLELLETPLAIKADLAKDEFVLECTDNAFFYLPTCSHCNRYEYHGTR